MARLVVVSNRVSVPTSRRAAAGGLAIGVEAALRERGGLWFGWSGELHEDAAAEARLSEQGKVSYALLDLSREEHKKYYASFSNRALWPRFHYRPDLASFDPEDYKAYRRVNQRFAQALLPLLEPDDTIWVHDYHLIPLGRELRRLGCKQRIGFFLHIPFPAAQIFVTLPCHAELGRDFADYDLIGFHTPTDVQQFGDYMTRELGATVGEGNRFRLNGRRFQAIDCPIGIDLKEVEKLRRSVESRKQARSLADILGPRKLIIGVDRLDYSKGIFERLRAYEHLLREYPKHRKNIVMMQISAPSREEVPEYGDMRRTVERLSGHINGRFGEPDWEPLRYINRTYSRRLVTGFCALGKVGLVTPLRDGLNLVAEEYVAAQDADDPGVLVLSRFAGAASFLQEALIVNPYDVDGVAAALDQALTMPVEERRERYAALMRTIGERDITRWRSEFLAALEDTSPNPASGA